CVIDQVTRLRAFALLPIVMMGRHMNKPEVHFFRAKHFHITAERSSDNERRTERPLTHGGRVGAVRALEIWADGERVGETPAYIELVPGAVRVLMPRASG
ncbi:MAG: hypothetical protein ACE5HE_13155, partial [Phycisphaerae bacterium]